MDESKRRPTDGARALRRWLTEREMSVPAFCEAHGLDRISVQRAMNGDRQRISVDLAVPIEKATRGAVTCAMWQRTTGRAPSKVGPKSRRRAQAAA